MNSIEIMSPVGSYESLMAALQAGAGSVYFGIGKLNMRSKSSQNFTEADLAEISKICKAEGRRRKAEVKTYITLNTVIYDHELEEMKGIVDAAKENDISAIIASDMAVINYARSVGMEVHMSTQTNITNIEAIKYFSQFADVMVTARELELKQVKAITKAIEEQDIRGPKGELVQIEIFVHGALCMAVSGKCYLSLDNLNSSANRGACLQQCRRPYRVFDKDGENELVIDNEYIMSPKDLNTLHFLDRIIDAGVSVLKIEGRGRSPEYVKTVTKVYHDAVEAIQKGEWNDEKLKEAEARLASVYNRGFWDGYYLGKKLGEWTPKYGNRATKKKMYVGKVTNFFTKLNVAEIKIETHDLNVGEDIRFIGPTTGVEELEIRELRVENDKVEKAQKGEFCSVQVENLVRRGDKVYKIIEVEDE